MPPAIPVPVGTQFNDWITTDQPFRNTYGIMVVSVKCSCGKMKPVALAHLRSGASKRCRRCSALLNPALKPFERKYEKPTKDCRIYRTWCAMMRRCYNQNCADYPDYGGRGIVVGERWHSYANFLQDFPEIPDGLSLDRIDVNGNYCPGNVRLATAFRQSNNRRNSRKKYEMFGKERTIAYWSEEFDAPKTVVQKAVEGGMNLKDALLKYGEGDLSSLRVAQ